MYHPRLTDLEPAPDAALAGEGWRRLSLGVGGAYDAFMQPVMVRACDDGVAEVLIPTGEATRNVVGRLHGGFIAAAAEQTMFLPLLAKGGIGSGGTVTVDFSLQYMGSGDATLPVLARVTLLRETGRMAFIRGEFLQGGEVIVAYAGTLRKIRPAA